MTRAEGDDSIRSNFSDNIQGFIDDDSDDIFSGGISDNELEIIIEPPTWYISTSIMRLIEFVRTSGLLCSILGYGKPNDFFFLF